MKKIKKIKQKKKKEDKVKLGFHWIKTSSIPENVINLPNYESVNEDKKSFKSKDFTKENVEKLKEELLSPKKIKIIHLISLTIIIKIIKQII